MYVCSAVSSCIPGEQKHSAILSFDASSELCQHETDIHIERNFNFLKISSEFDLFKTRAAA